MSFSIDLGKIKFRYRGDWNATTTYERDDVVYRNGSSYVCVPKTSINIDPANNIDAQWSKMAQGADVGTVMVDPGDLLYFDGTNFQRIQAPTHKGILTADGLGNYNWVRSSWATGEISITRTNTRGQYNGIVTPLITGITPQQTDSRICINTSFFGEMHWDRYIRLQYRINGGAWNWVHDSNSWVTPSYDQNTDSTPQQYSFTIYHDPNTTGFIEYAIHTNNVFDLNRAWNNNGEYGFSWMELTEMIPIGGQL